MAWQRQPHNRPSCVVGERNCQVQKSAKLDRSCLAFRCQHWTPRRARPVRRRTPTQPLNAAPIIHWTVFNDGVSSGSTCRWAREERQNQCKTRHLPQSQTDLVIRVLHMVLQCQSSSGSTKRSASDAAFTSPPAKRQRNDILWKSRHRSVKNTNPIHSRRGHPETDEDTWPTCAQSTRVQKCLAPRPQCECGFADGLTSRYMVRGFAMWCWRFQRSYQCSRW